MGYDLAIGSQRSGVTVFCGCLIVSASVVSAITPWLQFCWDVACWVWHHMICGVRVPDFAIRQEENWSKSNSCWAVSVETTERYLGCKQRLRNAVNDHMCLEPGT